MKKELLLWKIDDPIIDDEIKEFLIITRVKYNWFYFKWLQLKELIYNVFSKFS